MAVQDAPRVFVVGANHRSSTALLRDRLFIEESMMPQAFDRLRAAGIEQALILSTCDRTEIQGLHSAAEQAVADIRKDFGAIGNLAEDEISEQSYALYDDAALRHIFAVAASLDSQVIGEPQVLGQVRASHRLATECGMVGSELDAILQAAYGVAKRVRTETDIARRSVSIASAAAQVAQDLHGDLSRCRALVIGLGEIAELIYEQLRQSGLREATLTGPSRRVEATARQRGMHFAPYEDLPSALAQADIVVSAAGTGQRIVDAGMVEAALAARRRRPILFLDGGVPADLDGAIEDCDDAFLYALDDLERVALEGRARRQEAAADAWRIVEDGLATWQRRQSERGAVPAVVTLRDHFNEVREQVLRDNPGAGAEEATRLLINRLLHRPTTALRTIATEDDTGNGLGEERTDRLVQRLFGPLADKEDN